MCFLLKDKEVARSRSCFVEKSSSVSLVRTAPPISSKKSIKVCAWYTETIRVRSNANTRKFPSLIVLASENKKRCISKTEQAIGGHIYSLCAEIQVRVSIYIYGIRLQRVKQIIYMTCMQ